MFSIAMLMLWILQRMNSNKTDLAELCRKLEALNKQVGLAISSQTPEPLATRMGSLSSYVLAKRVRDALSADPRSYCSALTSLIDECTVMQKSDRIKRFIKGEKLAAKIAALQQSIRDMIQNFLVR